MTMAKKAVFFGIVVITVVAGIALTPSLATVNVVDGKGNFVGELVGCRKCRKHIRSLLFVDRLSSRNSSTLLCQFLFGRNGYPRQHCGILSLFPGDRHGR